MTSTFISAGQSSAGCERPRAGRVAPCEANGRGVEIEAAVVDMPSGGAPRCGCRPVGWGMKQNDARKLLDSFWGPRARLSEEVHYRVATRYEKWNQRMSSAVILITAVTGSGLFATLSERSAWLHGALAGASVVAAMLAGYQRSLGYAAKSVEHQTAGANWGVIVNETEKLRQELRSRDPRDSELEHLRRAMDTVTKQSPQIPEKDFAKEHIALTYLYEPREDATST
jgi:hypothetical protein